MTARKTPDATPAADAPALPTKLADITPAQILAAVTWVVSQAVAMGFASQEASKIIVTASSTILCVAWLLADAWIKHARNKARAAMIVQTGVDPAA